MIAFLWLARHILLLLFSSLLIALVFTSATGLLRRFVPVRQAVALVIVLILGAGLLFLIGWFAADPIARQIDELAETLPKAWADMQERIEQWSPYERIEEKLRSTSDFFSGGEGKKLFGFFSSVLATASSFVFIVFSSLFLAANPTLYKSLVIRILPTRHEAKGKEVIRKAISAIKSWLVGQAVSMLVIGVITGIGLALAGIPFSLALGVIAGLAEFIPFVGPILAAVPALLLAATLGLDKVLIVFAIMLGVQFVEGNIVMPIVQKKAVQLPPVLTLAAVFLLGGSFGILGMFVAAPLVAVLLVLVDELYICGYLKKQEPILDE